MVDAKRPSNRLSSDTPRRLRLSGKACRKADHVNIGRSWAKAREKARQNGHQQWLH